MAPPTVLLVALIAVALAAMSAVHGARTALPVCEPITRRDCTPLYSARIQMMIDLVNVTCF